jgi:hypothetical protein
MSLISAEIYSENHKPGIYARGGRIIVTAPWMTRELTIPFSSARKESRQLLDEAASWFSEFLNDDLRLFIKDSSRPRETEDLHTYSNFSRL